MFRKLWLPVLRSTFSAARAAAQPSRPYNKGRRLQPLPVRPAPHFPPCRHLCRAAAGGSSENERGPPSRGRGDASEFLSKLLSEELQALDQFFLYRSMEEELMSEARATVALRQHLLLALGDSSILTAAEEEEMESLAAGMGFSSREELLATLARVTGEDPWQLHLMLGVMAPRIRHRVELAMEEAQLDPSEEGNGPEACPDPSSARSKASSRSTSQSQSGRVGCRPCLYPTTSGLAPNSEINAKHEETRRLCDRENLSLFFVSGVAARSPFGPAAGGSSLDDLTPVTLQQLHKSHGLLPNAYLRLTVVLPAVMTTCPTTVVADDTGQRIRMAVYNTGAASVADAQALLPIGGRFALKNPFLKRCTDWWLGLRVDIPSTLTRLDLLPLSPGQRLLVLGDGDFSFSASLISSNSNNGEDAAITATSLDSCEEVLAKYAAAEEALECLSADPGVAVLHGVDATALPRAPGFSFDTVVWNFPYPDDVSLASCKVLREDLLGPFFACVGNVLEDGGRVWLTLAKEQGGSTREVAGQRKNIDIESIATEHGFELLEVFSADFSRYCGYEPRRAYADKTFPFEGARVHVFRQGEAIKRTGSSNAATAAADKPGEAEVSELNHELTGEGEDEPLGQHLQSKLAGMLCSRALMGDQYLSPTASVSSHMITSEALAPHIATSATARGLLCALMAFEAACQEATSPLPDEHLVVQLLAEALSERDGELVVHWESEETKRSVITCVQSVIEACLYAGCFPAVQRKPYEQQWEELSSFRALYSFVDLLELSVARQIGAPSGMQGGVWVAAALPEKMRNQLAAALFCFTTLTADDDIEAQLELIQVACSMGLEDPRLLRRLAQFLAFALNYLDAEPDGVKAEEKVSCAELIANCCDKVLRVDPEDMDAIFVKAFALRNHPDTARHAPEAMLLYGQYLQAAEPDERFRAAAHYHLGLLSIMQIVMSASENGGHVPVGDADELPEEAESAFLIARKQYEQGLAAEEKRLPFFQPQGVPSKELLGLLLLCVKGKGDEARARRSAAKVAQKEQEEAAAKARKAEKRARRIARKQQEQAAAKASQKRE